MAFVPRTNNLPRLLLALGIGLYIVVFGAAACYKYANYRMGFDLGTHEQVLWNTMYGRIAASSPFAQTESYFGIDVIPTELLITPLYALWPSAYTMLLVQAVAVALGAVPMFLIARDRWGSGWAGLAFAAALLLYLPVQYTNLYEFQIRAFATTFLLWAFYAQERRRFVLFLITALLALGCRSDVGLVLAGMGLYNALGGRLTNGERGRVLDWRYTVLPIVLGLGWFVLCFQVIVPWFRNGEKSLYLYTLYGTVNAKADGAPWLGGTMGEIFRTLLARPGFVLREVFFGADGRGAMRRTYLLEMFLPLLFLPLLRPRLLLITLPIFALNLLSNTPNIHASTRFHYQTLIVPFLLVATAYALADLSRRWRWRWAPALIVLMGVLCNAGVFGMLIGDRAFRSPLPNVVSQRSDKPAAAKRLLALVPPDAPLAATSNIGPFAARRTGIFFFPGNVIYPTEKVTQGQFLLIDSDESQIRPAGRTLLAQLQAEGRYRQVAEDSGISLWQKVP